MIPMSDFPKDSRRKLEAIVSEAMALGHNPGVGIALVKEGKMVYAEGFGARDVAKSLPATPETIYGIGSCTKSFTALAVMQLVQQGKLSVKDPVGDFLPFELGYEDSPITLHDLLSMASGVPSLGMANVTIEQATGVGERWIPLSSMDDFFRYVNAAGAEVAARPGERYFYLNAGYTVLGEVIERVSGTPYEDYVEDRILKPLGMVRSTFKRERFEGDQDAMTPYWKEKDGSMTPSVHPFHRLISAPGGLLSPVTELANYLFMNMGGGSHGGDQIVDSDLLEEMHGFHTLRGVDAFGRNGYGYGWGISEDFLGERLVIHTGSTGVSGACLAFIPDLNLGVAFATNTGGYSPLFYQAALALLMGKDPEEEIPWFAEEESLAALEGEYVAYKGTNRVSIVKKGALIYLEVDNKFMEMSAPLIPEHGGPRKFHVKMGGGRDLPVEFEETPEGGMDLYMERWRLHRKRK